MYESDRSDRTPATVHSTVTEPNGSCLENHTQVLHLGAEIAKKGIVFPVSGWLGEREGERERGRE
jgi:hypothetical protein